MYRCRLDFGSVENKDNCVEELGRKLWLTDSEKVGLVMPEGFFDFLDGEDNLLLVGKLLLHRAISIDAPKSSLVKTWLVNAVGNCCSRALYCKSRRRLEWSYTRIKKVTKCPVLEVAAASLGVLRLVVAKLGISWRGGSKELVRISSSWPSNNFPCLCCHTWSLRGKELISEVSEVRLALPVRFARVE
ncbi:hypothetical protein Droror1_Dr00013667 [Drosera rotundifolia]